MIGGHITAIVGRTGEVNSNCVQLEPGCIPSANLVMISAWGHSLDQGGTPVGVGTLHEDGADIVFVGRIDLSMPDGQLCYDLVKFAGDRCEWSMMWKVTESLPCVRGVPPHERRLALVCLLDPYEVSPVLDPAAAGTKTLLLDGEIVTPSRRK